MSAIRSTAGALKNGTLIEAVTLTNTRGISARILTYGATLQSLVAPDSEGQPADIVLGYDDVTSYEQHPNYFGTTIGRYANRIAGGRFVIDGRVCQLPLNDGRTSLHGGGNGFDRQVWRITRVESGAVSSVELAHRSPDNDAGYPGELDVRVTYSLDDSGSLTIAFEATTSVPTVLNLTNHAIFNLGGEGSASSATDHRLMIPAAAFTRVNASLIPTGEIRAVAGSVFDFRRPRLISAGMRDGRDEQIRFARGYDHNFVLDKGLTTAPELVARLEEPRSGRLLEVLSTEPGVQLYTGNFLDGTLVGKAGHLYRMGDGVALEPQKFPDSPNQPGFPSARVDPGKLYRHVMIYRLSAARASRDAA